MDEINNEYNIEVRVIVFFRFGNTWQNTFFYLKFKSSKLRLGTFKTIIRRNSSSAKVFAP